MAPRLPLGSWAQLQRARRLPDPTTLSTQLPFVSLTARRGVKYGWSTQPKRFKPNRFNQQTAGIPAPTTGPAAALKRKENTTPVRTGLLAYKMGMTGFYTNKGLRIPCTVLQLDKVQVVANKTRKANGYWAVQIGCGEKRPGNVTAPQLGYYEAKGIAPKAHLAEFKVRSEDGLLPVGAELKPDWFHVGQWVDVRANCKGKGFAGGMKRHGFSGQEASHGNSKNHRTIGSAGPSQGSGSRVLPGKKMPGRMGGQRVTVQNLNILRVDNEMGYIVVRGAVAGPKNGLVHIADAIKKPLPSDEIVQGTLQALKERHPDAKERLQAAREKHLELKEMRQQGQISQLIASGMGSQTLSQSAASA